jgi:hypothetical protein
VDSRVRVGSELSTWGLADAGSVAHRWVPLKWVIALDLRVGSEGIFFFSLSIHKFHRRWCMVYLPVVIVCLYLHRGALPLLFDVSMCCGLIPVAFSLSSTTAA